MSVSQSNRRITSNKCPALSDHKISSCVLPKIQTYETRSHGSWMASVYVHVQVSRISNEGRITFVKMECYTWTAGQFRAAVTMCWCLLQTFRGRSTVISRQIFTFPNDTNLSLYSATCTSGADTITDLATWPWGTKSNSSALLPSHTLDGLW